MQKWTTCYKAFVAASEMKRQKNNQFSKILFESKDFLDEENLHKRNMFGKALIIASETKG